MRRRTGFIAMIGSIAIVTGGVAAWVSPVTTASAGASQIEVFKPDGPYERVVDVGKRGIGAGDQILQSQPLLDPSDGSKVGRAVARVELVKHNERDDLVIIDATIQVEGGDIVVYGAARLSQLETGATFAVTGGTGAYDATAGTMTATVEEISGTTGVLLSFDLATA